MSDAATTDDAELDAAAPVGSGERRRPSRTGRGGSLLEFALLGVLADGELHGYELKKRLDGVLPSWSAVSFGSLYPTLGRLERAGDVVAIEGESTPAAPMTGALSGEIAAFRARRRERGSLPARSRRGRKVYAITPSGQTRLVDLLSSLDPSDDRAFSLMVAFSSHLTTDQRLAVLVRRRAELAARLEQSRGAAPALDRWRASLRSHAITALTSEIAWVDELLAAERLEGSAAPDPSTDQTDPTDRGDSTGGMP